MGIKIFSGMDIYRSLQYYHLSQIYKNETKILCDFDGCGIVRRFWITLGNRTKEVLQGVILRMYWDNASVPQVNVPLGDSFFIPQYYY